MGHDPNISSDQQRSSAWRAIAAIACVLFALLLLVAGGVAVGLYLVQRAVQQELADLGSAIAELDAAYDDPPTPIDVSAEQLIRELQADREAALGEYQNNLLRLGGTIVSIDDEALTLTLDAGPSADGQPQFIRAVMNGNGTHSASEFEMNAPSHYQPGNTIDIGGYVIGYEPSGQGVGGDDPPNTLVIEYAFLPLDQFPHGK